MASKNTKLSKAAAQRVRGYSAKTAEVTNLKQVRRSDNIGAIVAGVVSLLLAFGGQFLYTALHSNELPTSLPPVSVAENRDWSGSMNVDNLPVTFTLNGKLAPQGVANFVALARANYYNEFANSCHRVTTEGLFVLQCGDPQGDGSGGPGYSWGPIENAPASGLYPAGTIAMARQSGNGSSMGSQFFIVYKDTTLPADSAGGYTVLGKVDTGLVNLEKIAARGTADGSKDGRPKTDVKLSAVTVK
jgi:peptidyl-prolyl cis-trans isomerase B (cyclophilin B)